MAFPTWSVSAFVNWACPEWSSTTSPSSSNCMINGQLSANMKTIKTKISKG